jgi:N-methylhydantoinase A/oxoprolinase/acetone carboxylase beta subunit
MVLADMTVEKSRTVLGGSSVARAGAGAQRELMGRVERFVEARYQGQSHEIRIPEGADFHEAHRRLYGFTRREPVEVVNAVVRVTVSQPKPRRERFPAVAASGDGARGREGAGGSGARGDEGRDGAPGPVVITEETATTWVPKGGRPGSIHMEIL